MAEFPALPLFTDAYLGDTTHLSTFEHGAYLLLLIVSWRSPGCCLADDDALLARYTRMTRDKWRKVRPILEPFFGIQGGFWHQARLQNELQHLQSRRKQQVEAGNASAIAKSLKRGGRASTPVGKPSQRNGNEPPTPISYPVPLDKESNGDLDPEKVLFEQGLAFLTASGVPEKRGRPWLGKLKRDFDTTDVISALGRAKREGVFDVIPWVEAALKSKARTYDPERITV